MDNLGNNSPRADDSTKPIPFDNGPSVPAPAKSNPGGSAAPVSRAPLTLGGTGVPVAGPAAAGSAPASPSAPAAAPKPAPKIQAPPAPGAKPAVGAPGSAGRITACRTFFTKLHPGAIIFMDGQITNWLKENPGIVIKQTTAVTGEIVDKKTEPSILITVWY